MKAILIIATVGFFATGLNKESPLSDTFGTLVGADGEISMPRDFRAQYTHLGSWFVPEGEASGFHDVYAQQQAVEQFRATGQFPDGTVLVKELRAHDSKAMSTGTPAWANDTIKQWFVMVKDSGSRFDDNANWGDGWGWALFQPGKVGNVSADYKTDCLGCHVPAKTTDWVYVEGYPSLKKP